MDPPHVDVEVRKEHYKEDFPAVLKVARPEWSLDNIVYEQSALDVTRGVINTMVQCYVKDEPEDSIMLRILNYNPSLSEWIDRSLEAKAIKYLNRTDCAPKIYATFKNGFCYEYYHGEVLSPKRLREEKIWRSIAVEVAKVHSTKFEDESFRKEPLFNHFLGKFFEGYPSELKDPIKNERFKKEIPSMEDLKKEIDYVLSHLLSFNHEVVVGHNDLRAENMVWNEKTGKVKFVDFEGAGYNYRANDLSYHFDRYGGLQPMVFEDIPDEKFQKEWLRLYLETCHELEGKDKSSVTDAQIHKLYVQVQQFQLVFCIVSVISGPVMENAGIIPDGHIDFLQLSINCLKHYHERKEEVFALR